MRIAYVAPYQGPTLIKRRPLLKNLSLGSNTKIELIALLLQKNSHDVEIFSQGEVVRHQFKFYRGFEEPKRFDRNIPVYYGSAFPVRYLNGLSSTESLLKAFKARHEVAPFDLVLTYNLKPPQVSCAKYAIRRLGLPVILEYEDDLFLKNTQDNRVGLTSRWYLGAARELLRTVSGSVAGSPYLLSQVNRDVPKLFLPGIVGESILNGTQADTKRKNWVVFSGTHSWAQGLEQLVQAWKLAQLRDWELHIAGQGHLTATLHELAKDTPGIIFHGVLSPQENAKLLTTSKIAVVPYDVSQSNGFSFKTIECLAAALHVVTTPLRALEGLGKEMQSGITYLKDNAPETIAACLQQVIESGRYEQTSQQAALERYGPAAASNLLETFLKQVMAFSERCNCHG